MDCEEMIWETVDDRLPPEADLIDAGLDRFNQQAADLDAVRQFACFVRDPSGTLIGGALARWWGQCCEIQQMWVEDACRSQGIGGRLVRQVEDYARERGCTVFYLETFSFQSPHFYAALGYKVACEFKGFPDGVSKLIMCKELG